MLKWLRLLSSSNWPQIVQIEVFQLFALIPIPFCCLDAFVSLLVTAEATQLQLLCTKTWSRETGVLSKENNADVGSEFGKRSGSVGHSGNNKDNVVYVSGLLIGMMTVFSRSMDPGCIQEMATRRLLNEYFVDISVEIYQLSTINISKLISLWVLETLRPWLTTKENARFRNNTILGLKYLSELWTIVKLILMRRQYVVLKICSEVL